MIIVDTNVISEVMSIAPSGQVLSWLNEQSTEHLYLTTITIAEIGYGLRILPEGKRRHQLEKKFKLFVETAFEERVLNFDEEAARAYADVMGHRKEIGRPLSVPDGQIASIARAQGFAVSTRNIRDFEELGLTLINPY